MARPPKASKDTRSEPRLALKLTLKSDLPKFGFSCRVSVNRYTGSVVVFGFTLIGHPIKLIGCLLIAWELGSIGFSCRSPLILFHYFVIGDEVKVSTQCLKQIVVRPTHKSEKIISSFIFEIRI